VVLIFAPREGGDAVGQLQNGDLRTIRVAELGRLRWMAQVVIGRDIVVHPLNRLLGSSALRVQVFNRYKCYNINWSPELLCGAGGLTLLVV